MKLFSAMPRHIEPQFSLIFQKEALVVAVEGGLRLPLVYNTSAYDSLESRTLRDGVVDIYMPDLKLFHPALAVINAFKKRHGLSCSHLEVALHSP